MSDLSSNQTPTWQARVTTWLRRALPVIIIASVVIALDQWTKIWVRETIPTYEQLVPFPALADYFRFQHVYNYGAAFGILQGMGNFFIVIAFIVSAAILYYAGTLPSEQRWVRVLLGLQMGGAIGNVIDRIYQGYVTDFVVTGIPGIYYIPNYNIADASIVCGVIGLGIYLFADDIKRHRAEKRASAAGEMQQGGPPAPAPSRDG
jgi:signal peptidase II